MNIFFALLFGALGVWHAHQLWRAVTIGTVRKVAFWSRGEANRFDEPEEFWAGTAAAALGSVAFATMAAYASVATL